MDIIINGLYGKMGQALMQGAPQKGCRIVAGIDPRGAAKGEPFPVYQSIDQCRVKADGLIDFSTPGALPALLAYGKANHIPLVLATTGYQEEDLRQIAAAAKDVAILQSANMSLGVAVLKALTVQAAKMLGRDFDIEMTETHHHHKVDAPSGTALMLFNSLKNEVDSSFTPVYGRQGHTGPRQPREVGIHALRGGTVPGTHDVHFFGQEQTITLSHQANNRSIFALGALDAIKFVKQKEPGLYTIDDLVLTMLTR